MASTSINDASLVLPGDEEELMRIVSDIHINDTHPHGHAHAHGAHDHDTASLPLLIPMDCLTIVLSYLHGMVSRRPFEVGFFSLTMMILLE
jgi:hypothetical protein